MIDDILTTLTFSLTKINSSSVKVSWVLDSDAIKFKYIGEELALRIEPLLNGSCSKQQERSANIPNITNQSYTVLNINTNIVPPKYCIMANISIYNGTTQYIISNTTTVTMTIITSSTTGTSSAQNYQFYIIFQLLVKNLKLLFLHLCPHLMH